MKKEEITLLPDAIMHIAFKFRNMTWTITKEYLEKNGAKFETQEQLITAIYNVLLYAPSNVRLRKIDIE